MSLIATFDVSLLEEEEEATSTSTQYPYGVVILKYSSQARTFAYFLRTPQY